MLYGINYANGKPIKAETLIGDIRREKRNSIAFPYIGRRKEYTCDYVLEMRSFSLKGMGWEANAAVAVAG